jgi:protein-disulfide isomerase
MKKFILLLLLLLSLVLSACAGNAQQTSQPTSPPAPTTVLTVPAANEPAGPDSGCTVISRKPTPGPTQESLFPPVSKDDWVKGPENAKVTIIEYADFQ